MVTKDGSGNFTVHKYFHTNRQGSVVAMSDDSGALAEGPYKYDPYGNCFVGNNPCSSGVPYRFTGRRLDPETGLYYYRARCYSAVLGRFCQTDPVGYTADLNLYTYVGNDPTDRTDPRGVAPGDWYDTPEEAAEAAIEDINPTSIRENTEYAGRVYHFWFSNGWSYTAPNRGDVASSYPGTCLTCRDAYHTHGGNDPRYQNEVFSDEDMKYSESLGYPLWLGTPKGHILKYDPNQKRGHKITKLRRSEQQNQNGRNPAAISQQPGATTTPVNGQGSGGSNQNSQNQSTPNYSQGHCPGAQPGLSCGLGGGLDVWGQ